MKGMPTGEVPTKVPGLGELGQVGGIIILKKDMDSFSVDDDRDGGRSSGVEIPTAAAMRASRREESESGSGNDASKLAASASVRIAALESGLLEMNRRVVRCEEHVPLLLPLPLLLPSRAAADSNAEIVNPVHPSN